MSDRKRDRADDAAWLARKLQDAPGWKLTPREARERAEKALARGDRNRENGNR